MKELIARLEAATEGSRELDGDIALAIGLYKVWLSKHRYWNFEGPNDKRGTWPDSGIPEYDSRTGKKIVLTEKPDRSWVYYIGDVPEFTTSIEAALTLVPEGWGWEVGSPYADGEPLGGGQPWAQIWKRGANVRIDGLAAVPYAPGRSHTNAQTPALALCIAALRARS